MKTVRVWDLPLRLFHWSLVLLVAAAVVTQKIGGNAMEWHFRAGYAILALTLFRILWGFAGPRYARFSEFVHSPLQVVSYVKGRLRRSSPGHNPLGSFSVLALLAILLIQASTGLFSNDDIASEGPLMKLISKDMSDRLTWFHKEVSAVLIYSLVALHVAAIGWYLLRKKENLVKPMITGDKVMAEDAEPAKDTAAMRLRAVLLLLLCAGAVYAVVTLKP